MEAGLCTVACAWVARGGYTRAARLAVEDGHAQAHGLTIRGVGDGAQRDLGRCRQMQGDKVRSATWAGCGIGRAWGEGVGEGLGWGWLQVRVR